MSLQFVHGTYCMVFHGTWMTCKSKAMLTGAAVLAPPSSKHPKRALVTVDLMERIFPRLDMAKPLDVALASCFSTVFYSVVHTGEFTLPTLSTFAPHNMLNHPTYPTSLIKTTWKSWFFISQRPSAHQKGKMYSGHSRMESQIPRLPLNTTFG